MNRISITTPCYFHREYSNDIGKPTQDASLLNQCTRVALVALPFISLYKPAGFALALGMGSLRIFTHLTVFLSSPGQFYQNLIQLAISSVSLAGTVVAHPLGMLIATGQDVVMETVALGGCFYNGKYGQAVDHVNHILNNAVYLSLFLGGGLQLSICSLSIQVTIACLQSFKEFIKGHWLEGCGHLSMAVIRFNQKSEQLKILIEHECENIKNVVILVYGSNNSGAMHAIKKCVTDYLRSINMSEGFKVLDQYEAAWARGIY